MFHAVMPGDHIIGLPMGSRAPPSAADGSGEVALARVLRRLRDDGARRFFCISNPNPNTRLVRDYDSNPNLGDTLVRHETLV